MEVLINFFIKLFDPISRFFFGNTEKRIEHERKLKKLQLDMEALEKTQVEELKTLDQDIHVLWGRRRIEGLTRSEVLNEWDKKRGDIREGQFNKIGYIENDISYHEQMIDKNTGLFWKNRKLWDISDIILF